MPQVLYPPARPLSAGEALDLIFRIFRTTLVRCLPHGVLAVVAGHLSSVYSLAVGRSPGVPQEFDPAWYFFYLLGALATLLLWSAVMVRQHAIASGQPAATREELMRALRRLPPVGALMLLLFVLVALAVLVAQTIDPSGDLLPLLLIPGVPAMMIFSLGWPVVVLTDRGPLSALKYSFRLLVGNFLRTLLVVLVTLIVIAAFCLTLVVLVMLVMQAAGISDVTRGLAVIGAALLAPFAAVTPLICAQMLVIFGDLQVRKEGADLERRIAGVASD